MNKLHKNKKKPTILVTKNVDSVREDDKEEFSSHSISSAGLIDKVSKFEIDES